MDSRQPQIFSFQVSRGEAEEIETAMRSAGMKRSEYLRKKVLSPVSKELPTDAIKLLRHIIYILARIHSAAYYIPERQQTLTTEALQAIYDDTIKSAREYIAHLDEHLAAAASDGTDEIE